MKETCAIIFESDKDVAGHIKKPTLLEQILFRPILSYLTELCGQTGILDLCICAEHQSQMIADYLTSQKTPAPETISVVTPTGQTDADTDPAIQIAEHFLEQHTGQHVLILCDNTPFLDAFSVQTAFEWHCAQKNAVTSITVSASHSEQSSETCEMDSGSYWFSVDALLNALRQLAANQSQNGYHLTDCIAFIRENSSNVGSYLSPNCDIALHVCNKQDLYFANEKMRMKIIEQHLKNGVEFVSTDGVYIAPDAKIGTDTVIFPGTILKEEVVIGEDCTIGPNTLIQKSAIGNRVKLNSVQCYQSIIHEDVDIGPFVHIRPNSEIHHHVHIGDFVEVKNSTIGAGTGISHLTYVGDSDVGKNVNFGCGVVTVNYDGVHKNRCKIGDGAFIGCNTNLVAPVTLGENAYTAAGSTITDDVPSEALGIARAKQAIKPGFSTKKLAGRKKKV